MQWLSLNRNQGLYDALGKTLVVKRLKMTYLHKQVITHKNHYKWYTQLNNVILRI